MTALAPTTLTALAALTLVAAAPTVGHAFAELPRYAEPALDGGGGGRYFTGGPSDGFGCSVCHHGGAAPTVTIDGLPDQLAVGTRYDLALSWPDDGRRYALALELIDGQGQHPGVAVPALADQLPAMKCAEPAGAAAVTTVDGGGRRVVTLAPCGAHALHLSFTPTADAPLYFAVSVVASDHHEDVRGDGVLEVRRTLNASSGGCSAGGPAPGALVALAALGLWWRPRRRRDGIAVRT